LIGAYTTEDAANSRASLWYKRTGMQFRYVDGLITPNKHGSVWCKVFRVEVDSLLTPQQKEKLRLKEFEENGSM